MNPDANEQNGVFFELGPWAAQRNEQETPRGLSKSVKHVRHFVSSRNDGLIQLRGPQTQFTLWHLHLVSLSKATGETKLLDFQTLWQNTQYADRSSRLRLLTLIFPLKSDALPMYLCVRLSRIGKRDTASSAFKSPLCQTWLWIHKGKHITWNQIGLMTFCRIHGSLVVWHFQDRAWGTQHNK